MPALFFGAVCIGVYCQEQIGGVINHYAKVNSIEPGYVMVSSAQAAQFASGDYVLLIQMQESAFRLITDPTVVMFSRLSALRGHMNSFRYRV